MHQSTLENKREFIDDTVFPFSISLFAIVTSELAFHPIILDLMLAAIWYFRYMEEFQQGYSIVTKRPKWKQILELGLDFQKELEWML